MGVVGYNFEFSHPFQIIYHFQLLFWERTKEVYGLDQDSNRGVKQIMKQILVKFTSLASEIALKSAVMPLALYFEPEEIAISSLAIASLDFKFICPFQTGLNNQSSDELFGFQRDMVPNVIKNKKGNELIQQFWHKSDFIDFDFSRNYFEISSEEALF